jgi:acyl carrier protein
MTLHRRLEELFQNVLGDDDITLRDSTTAQDVEQWDSFAHINLMCAVEEEFNVVFPGNLFAEFADIGELKRYLETNASQPGSATRRD